MNKSAVDEALSAIAEMKDLVDEANNILNKLTIDDVTSHAELTDSVAEMKRLFDEMLERKERIQNE